MQKYTKGFAAVHWIHAILITLVLLGGMLNLPDLPKTGEELAPFKMHMIMGFLVFVVLIVRLVMVKKQPTLKPLEMSKVKEKLVDLNHKLLYIFIALTTISGMVTAKSANVGQVLIFGKDPSVYTGPGGITATLAQIHSISAYILLGLVVMHIVGVIIYIAQGHKDVIKRVWF